MQHRVSDLFHLQMGKTPSRNQSEYWESGSNKWVSISDLSNCSMYTAETKEAITDCAVRETNIRLVPKNTVIMSFKLSIGKTAITSEPVYTNEAIMAFINKDEELVLPEFLYYQLLSKDWGSAGNRAVMGTTLNKASLSQMKIYVPSLQKQQDIVQILSHIDSQLKKTNESVNNLNDLVKSRFIEMFGDTYLNSMNWTSCRLGDLISFMTSGSRGWARYYSDDGGYFLTIKNVRNCTIDISDVQHVVAPEGKESLRTKVQENDVLISITADLGRTGVVTKEIADHGAYINQHLACIRLIDDSVHSVFLSHFLESPGGINQFAKKNQNGVKAGLNFNLIRSLEIQMPPLALQQEFADFVSRVDKLRFELARQCTSCVQL